VCARWIDEELQSGTRLPCLPWKTSQPAGAEHLFRASPVLSEEGVEEKGELSVGESLVWLVFTDRHVYLIDDSSVADSRRLGLRFTDAPRPLVLRRYPLQCLQLLQIGFLFQSLLLGFAGAEKDGVGDAGPAEGITYDPSLVSAHLDDRATFGDQGFSAVPQGGLSRVFVTDGSGSFRSGAPLLESPARSGRAEAPHVVQAGGFVFLTRDKPTTSALLTEVAALATASRARQRPPVLPENVPVSNNDDAVLEALALLGVKGCKKPKPHACRKHFSKHSISRRMWVCKARH
jgi:hypothetical protein